jgi:hypothetical protein
MKWDKLIFSHYQITNITMFQAYDIESIKNIEIRQTAQSLLAEGQLTPPQYEAVKETFPVAFKQTNIFMKIGLFIFMTLCILFGCGLLSLALGPLFFSSSNGGGLVLFYAISLFALNEFLIRENHWYRSGSDNALLYAAIVCLIGSIELMTGMRNPSSYLFLILIILGIATWRYGDPLLAFGAFATLLAWLFTMCKDFGLSLATIPLSLAVVSFTTYFFSKNQKNTEGGLYWADCFQVLEIAGLAAFYGSINYYVIQSAAISLDNRFETEALPLGSVFTLLTALVPVAYLVLGIKNRDRILWIMGSFCLIASVLTYRHYHSIMPIEWSLTLAGLAFLALGLFLMKYLATPRNGFAYQPERAKNNALEALLMNQVLQQTHNTGSVQDTPPQYGGGDFGGGGASADF